jgi:hypothetical protein
VLIVLAALAVKKGSEEVKKITVSVVTGLLTLLLVEGVFFFVPKTSNYGKSLANSVWERYWWRNNLNGFRDKEFTAKDSTKKKLVFIGDSFTAGQGIKNPDDRYSNLVGFAVKDSFEFYNVGISGTNTETKAQTLYTLPFKPDVLVYEYFADDVVDTRIRLDSVEPHKDPYKGTPAILVSLIENSYLLNYLYWSFPHFMIADYKTYLTDSYQNAAVDREHKKVMSRLISYCKANNIRLVFLTIPLPTEYAYSNALTKNMEQLFADSNLININPTPALDTIPLKEIMVNDVDTHLNERGNKILANQILEKAFGIKP